MTLEKIGRYIILSELGRGGMATVYRAKDPSFDREVAVKVLPQTFLHDPQFRARFEREAKTIAALEHTAIVPVYDFGEDNGQPYIVMRLMSGGSLADKIKDGKLPLKEAANVITRLAPGLDAAHTKGVIHRDLKPGNILFDQYNNAYLSDFGIARLTEGDATLTGSRILGTPAYMSPEQIQGDKNIDGRSDIYAMGVIFYQMLVGNTPYQATTPAKVMMMHLLEPVPNILSSLPDLPPAVETWLEKALAKEPDERFSKAGEMGEALTEAMQGKAVRKPEAPKTVMATPGVVTTQKSRPITQPPPAQQAYTNVPVGTLPQYLTPPPQAAPKKSRVIPITIGAIAIFGIGAIAVIALVFSGMNGSGPLAAFLAPVTATLEIAAIPLDTNTPEPVVSEPEVKEATPTEVPPTPSEVPPTPTTEEAIPIDTPEPTPTEVPALVSVGGADKIAFINENNVWLMNVDGSDMVQLTNDAAVKTDLKWTPDGTGLTFISGRTVWKIDYATLRIDIVASFESAEYLESFTISPDGSQVAISVNRELYVVPYDLERLGQVRYNSDLKEMSECKTFAPLLTGNKTPVPVKMLRWSKDGQSIAILILANSGGKLVDLIRVHEIYSCTTDLIKLDEIPASRFVLDGYDKVPTIQNFGFDGGFLYALVSYIRNDGFGNLYIYNANLHKADTKVNPINGNCCYRDVQFSPDGRYLIFVYQPYEAGARAQLYYIPYASIGTGAQYEPLPLPEYFFENSREKPSPVLRPVQ